MLKKVMLLVFKDIKFKQNIKIIKKILIITMLASLISCQNGKLGSLKFSWVTKLDGTNCPQIGEFPYAELDIVSNENFKEAKVLYSKIGEIDYEKSFLLFKKEALRGHWPSMYYLGKSYYYGEGVKESDEKAKYWLKMIAGHNEAYGYYALAFIYSKGIDVKKDTKKAMHYINESAKLGFPEAQYIVGRYLFSPLHRFEDSRKILHCAVNQGHKDAAWELAAQYKNVAKDMDMAYKIYRKGAKLGSTHCLNALRKAYSQRKNIITGKGYKPTFGLNKDKQRAICFEELADKIRKNPDMKFDLDKLCPANIKQPTNRD